MRASWLLATVSMLWSMFWPGQSLAQADLATVTFSSTTSIASPGADPRFTVAIEAEIGGDVSSAGVVFPGDSDPTPLTRFGEGLFRWTGAPRDPNALAEDFPEGTYSLQIDGAAVADLGYARRGIGAPAVTPDGSQTYYPPISTVFGFDPCPVCGAGDVTEVSAFSANDELAREELAHSATSWVAPPIAAEPRAFQGGRVLYSIERRGEISLATVTSGGDAFDFVVSEVGSASTAIGLGGFGMELGSLDLEVTDAPILDLTADASDTVGALGAIEYPRLHAPNGRLSVVQRDPNDPFVPARELRGRVRGRDGALRLTSVLIVTDREAGTRAVLRRKLSSEGPGAPLEGSERLRGRIAGTKQVADGPAPAELAAAGEWALEVDLSTVDGVVLRVDAARLVLEGGRVVPLSGRGVYAPPLDRLSLTLRSTGEQRGVVVRLRKVILDAAAQPVSGEITIQAFGQRWRIPYPVGP